MKKILITGVAGFAGRYLAELLSETTDEIHGTYYSHADLDNTSPILKKIHVHHTDLTQYGQVERVVDLVRPDAVYHLAAVTSPAESFVNSTPIVLANIGMQMNMLNALKSKGLENARIMITSSAEVYGLVNQMDLPIDEETPFRPANPYAVSKITQDYLALQYFLSYNMPIVRVRPFNHTGPRQTPRFVVPAFAKQIAEIEKDKREPILRVGNLEAARDFTDVRDMVRAYKLAMEKGEAGDVYNIGSGTSHKIRDVLETLLSFSRVPVKVEVDSDRMVPVDVPELAADARKFSARTGWKTHIPLAQTLKDTLDYWREIV